jgi:acetylornithine deacetylase/succinyl-diaminopimelate desuccinylase-like protein
MNKLDTTMLLRDIEDYWRDSILEQLAAYIRIPNQSPLFDPQWESHGHMERAVALMANWCRAQPIANAHVEVRRLPGLTPLLLVDVPGDLPGCVLFYGHLDKQPAFTGWEEGLGPWSPVVRDGKLYGRGGADDGYAVFSSLAAIRALKARNAALPRCLVMIEASEESGSIHLPAHLDDLGAGLGAPALVICLDAECGNYAQLWSTTSLRGNLVGQLRVRILEEGVHSGMATGIAPTPMRVAARLIARLESCVTGDLLLDELQAVVPRDRLAQLALAGQVLGAGVAEKIPFAKGVHALSNDPVELLINSTWRATLAVTGADGLPAVQSAGNVLLPEITLNLSLRLPPTCPAERASAAVRRALECDPPYGAQVRFQSEGATAGWNAPPLAPWLERSMSQASREIFGHEAVHVGSGGTIPFMGMLGERFPQTQFFVTGVLGPHANAHGPNEFLHIDYARRLTACVALVLADFAAQA